MAQELRNGISDLQGPAKAAFAVLAIASGIYTYIGVRGLLGTTNFLSLTAAVAYSMAVSIGIFVFWLHVLRFLPVLPSRSGRLQMLFAMGLGGMAIVAMSSWLNAAALAGSAAVEQHLAVTVERYRESLEQAQRNALAAQELLPDVLRAEQGLARLAEQESRKGVVSGAVGQGAVAGLLEQQSARFAGLARQITESKSEVRALYLQGSQHLNAMRRLVTGDSPTAARSLRFAEQALELSGVITTLERISVVPTIGRAAESLANAYVQPVISGESSELRRLQQAALANIQRYLGDQAAVLSRATATLQLEPVPEVDFSPISSAVAVVRYGRHFVPAWAGAISIDLLPGLIVLILMIVRAAIRDEEGSAHPEGRLTLRDLHQALTTLQDLEKATRERTLRTPGPDGRTAAMSSCKGLEPVP